MENAPTDALEWLYYDNNLTNRTHRIRRHKVIGNQQTAADLVEKIEDGMVGCFGRITVDGFDVSKTEQGLRLHNGAIGCDASSMGPCLSVPCQNDGQCVPNRSENSFR